MKRAKLSAMLLGRNAETMATGIPTIHESATDRTAICAVSGPRRRIISATLSERKKERPKFPRAISCTQLAYWSHSGSLKPRSAM
jgi:hypothetical protein